jgi:peptidoglycan/LPS O-acetylase OafA/YrhL
MVEMRLGSHRVDKLLWSSRTAVRALPSNLPRLTALRAFAALFVFSYHMQLFGVAFTNDLPFKFGYSGVSFFFILSGFVLTWNMKPGEKWRAFYRRRVARIYPTYLVMLGIAFLFPFPTVPGHTTTTIVAAVLLIQGWWNDVGTTYAINPPSWSLSCEALFYLLLPMLFPVVRWFRPYLRWLAAGVLFALMSVVVVHGANDPASFQFAFSNPLVRTGEFMLGVVAALEIRRGLRVPLVVGLLVIGASMAMVATVSQTIPVPNLELDPLWLAVIVLCAQFDLAKKPGILRSRPLVYAGEVSFAFYLVHQFTLLHFSSALGNHTRVAAMSLAAAAVFAIVLHHVVELPMQRLILGRGLWRKRQIEMSSELVSKQAEVATEVREPELAGSA